MSRKQILVELDIGKNVELFLNESAFVWKLNLNGNYPGIEAYLLNGYESVGVVNVGSIKSDSTNLNSLSSLALVQAAPGSFYYDSVARNVFIHYPDSNDPGTHQTLIGAVFGYSNFAVNYNGVAYESRIINPPSISQSKDPLFFGRLSFQSVPVAISNQDGRLDRFAEDNDWFGNNARIYVAEDPTSFDDFTQIFQGYLENIRYSAGQTMTIQIQDQRKQLSNRIPENKLDVTTYPDIEEKNINRPIQLTYGIARNVTAICTNEEETPTPTNYNFKFADTTFHDIQSVDNGGKVYVEGVLKTPASIDLTAGEFVITSASGDYSPGDDVTLDIHGYEDISGNLIENGLDVIKDILVNYTTYKFSDDIYNVGEWTVATSLVSDISYIVNKYQKVDKAIEDISASIQTNIYFQGDGRLTAKKYDISFPSLQTFTKFELMEIPSIEYPTDEIITTPIINYAKDWDSDDYFKVLVDDSQEEDLFELNKTSKMETFDTVLTTQADAQKFSNTVIEISGLPRKLITTKYKLQPLQRKIGDFITIPVWRNETQQILDDAKVEIISITFNLSDFTTTIVGRVLEFITPTITQQGTYWGGTYWGGDYWSKTEQKEI